MLKGQSKAHKFKKNRVGAGCNDGSFVKHPGNDCRLIEYFENFFDRLSNQLLVVESDMKGEGAIGLNET